MRKFYYGVLIWLLSFAFFIPAYAQWTSQLIDAGIAYRARWTSMAVR